MGGDHAPHEIIAGALAAVRDLADRRVQILLVGPGDQLSAEVARLSGGSVPASISFLDAPEFIAMDEAPLAGLRRKPRASIKVAAEAVARGDADALYSAGHTGATLLAAHAAFGVLPGAERPAVAVMVPTLTGAAVVLDTGATLECRPEHLRAFGLMGDAYARIVLGQDTPRVGVLSVGEEAGKGNELVREAHALLAASRVNFVGNIEARDIFSGRADVIVCDGFTGNIVLKVGEGLIDALEHLLRRELVSASLARTAAADAVGSEAQEVSAGADATVQTALGVTAMADAFQRLRNRIDAAEHGGAPLLGVNGLALVGHGRSDARVVRNGIATSVRLVEGRIVERMSEALA